MSGRVCLILRGDRGSRIEACRLVGARSDEQWTAPVDPPRDAAAGEEGTVFDESPLASVAGWIASRSKEPGSALSLGAICLDSEGFSASWVTSATPDQRAVHATAVAGVLADAAGSGVGPGLHYFLTDEREASVQGLGTGTLPAIEDPADPDAPRLFRVPVLAGADAPVRLLLDALDQAGVEVDRVTTIWHAMAAVWASPAGEPARADDAVVADDASVACVTMVDPRGRLLWCWSLRGELLAGGSLRLSPSGVGRAPVPSVDDAARLTADWIAWSSQLGVVPRRVICIGADDPVGEGEDAASFRVGRFGARLATLWSGATVDVVLDQDPLGRTMSRLALWLADRSPGEPVVGGVQALESRPGRAQRSMHRGVAIGMLGAAGLLLAGAWVLRSASIQLAKEAEAEDARWKQIVEKSRPAILKMPGTDVEAELARLIERHQQERERTKIEPQRPIIQELETLTLVLADPEIELESISASGGNGSVEIRVLTPDIKSSESVFKSLTSIQGSNIESWRQPTFGSAGDGRVRATFTGSWRSGRTPAASASRAAPAASSSANRTANQPASAAATKPPAPVAPSPVAAPQASPTAQPAQPTPEAPR